jgi:carboxymethylenebutenolidase
MHEDNIIIKTNDGNLDCSFFISDIDSKPNIIFYMDAPAIREELRDMCRRIALHGYNVLLPNLFYRQGTENNYPFDQKNYKSDKNELKKMIQTMNQTSNTMIIEDTYFLLAYLDQRVQNKKVGIVGYCMSGRFVVSCGAKYANQIKAIASFYGVDIITDQPDSPHLLAKEIKGEIYLAFAEKDIWVSSDHLAKIKNIFSNVPATATFKIYTGTNHGFAFPNRSTYVKSAAEKHWNELIKLFDRNLK